MNKQERERLNSALNELIRHPFPKWRWRKRLYRAILDINGRLDKIEARLDEMNNVRCP